MRDTCETHENGRWVFSQAGCAENRVSEVLAEWKINRNQSLMPVAQEGWREVRGSSEGSQAM